MGVKYYNIRWDDTWMTANIRNIGTKREGYIRLNLKTDEYESDFKGFEISGAFGIARMIKDGRIKKQGSEKILLVGA